MVSCDRGKTIVSGDPKDVIAECSCLFKVMRTHLIGLIGQEKTDKWLHQAMDAVFMSEDELQRLVDEKRKRKEEIEKMINSPEVSSIVEKAADEIVQMILNKEDGNEQR